MESNNNPKARARQGKKPALSDRRILSENLETLSGKQVLDTILNLDRPRKVVQSLSDEDFFWLVKKVGDDDCLPLLQLASQKQWQYMLDLEIWKRDQIDAANVSLWLNRLQKADCPRLATWFFTDGQALAYHYFFRNLQVVTVGGDDEALDLPEGFFTLDGVFYIRVMDPENRVLVENIIRTMASADYDRFQALLLGLAGVLPAEMEEDMYRMRNVRLAEHGFLPPEEAVSIYAPLEPGSLGEENRPNRPEMLLDDQIRAMIPLSPLAHAKSNHALILLLTHHSDPLFVDRLRLEFAGLCNQILSADGTLVNEFGVLVNACKRASGYLNLAIERMCGNDISAAAKLLEEHDLVSLFRVGFGLVLKLKWEAERWLKRSWFLEQGLAPDFWGEEWGGVLSGLIEQKPRFYSGLRDDATYRDFETLSDLGESLDVLRRLMVLDSLAERLVRVFGMDKHVSDMPNAAFRPPAF